MLLISNATTRNGNDHAHLLWDSIILSKYNFMTIFTNNNKYVYISEINDRCINVVTNMTICTTQYE